MGQDSGTCLSAISLGALRTVLRSGQVCTTTRALKDLSSKEGQGPLEDLFPHLAGGGLAGNLRPGTKCQMRFQWKEHLGAKLETRGSSLLSNWFVIWTSHYLSAAKLLSRPVVRVRLCATP